MRLNPIVDEEKGEHDRRGCARTENELLKLAANEAWHQEEERRADCERVHVEPKDERGNAACQPCDLVRALPSMQAHECRRDERDEEDVHPRRLRIDDEHREKRNRSDEREIPMRL